jgi:hypothetical protein
VWKRQQVYCTFRAAAVLSGFVALALYLDPQSATRLNPFAGEQCIRSESTAADYYACRLVNYTHQLSGFTLFLFGATVLLGGIGWYQGHQLRQQAAIAKRTLFELERAYISGGGVRLRYERFVEGKIGVHFSADFEMHIWTNRKLTFSHSPSACHA